MGPHLSASFFFFTPSLHLCTNLINFNRVLHFSCSTACMFVSWRFIPWLTYPNIRNHNGLRKMLSVQFPGASCAWLVSNILPWFTHFTPQQAACCGRCYPAISIQSEGDKNNLAASVSSCCPQLKGQSVSPAPAFQREIGEEGITPSTVYYKNIYSY